MNAVIVRRRPRAPRAALRWARLVAACAALVCLFAASFATAQPADPEAEGKRLAKDGFEAYKSQEYDKALGLFQEARKLYPTGQVLRMTGYSFHALHRWAEAADAIDAALAATYKPLSDSDRSDAEGYLSEALKHLSVVTVKSSVSGAKATVDGGEPKSMPFDVRLLEGEHRFKASARDHEDATTSVTLKGGEPKQLTLDPKPKKAPEPPPPPQPPVEPEPVSSPGWFPYQGVVGLATTGVGAAVGAVGVGLLVYGSTLRSAASDNLDAHVASYGSTCERGSLVLCYYDTQLINRDGERAANAFRAGLGLTITGVAVLAAGITFVATAPSLTGSGQDDDKDKAPGSSPPKTSIACLPGVDAAGGSVACGGSF